MRLHSLEATAFGPFADTVAIDFDALSASGLFLLSGPTGAGKSSILDAVCFALYGDVPGDRAVAKRLRCDQAAPGVAPTVGLEVTLSGRRWRIERSPAWQRPKKRGTGITTEQASVHLAERVDGQWVTRSTRLDEAGHLMTRLVGMNLPQFCQVAMLPQGRFQAFLRARSEERHALLQQVFRTGRFDQVERWLREHRVSVRRTSEQHATTVAALVSRISETADRPAPDHEASPADLRMWLDVVQAGARATSYSAAVAVAAADDTSDRASRRLSEAEQLRALQAAHAEAADLMAGHDAEAHEAARTRVERAQRAAGLLGLDHTLVEADGLREVARREAARTLAAWTAVTGSATVGPEAGDDLTQALADSAAALQRAEAMRPDAERLHEVRRLCDEVGALVGQVEVDLAAAVSRADALPQRLAQLRADLRTAEEAVVLLPGAAAQVEQVRARRDAARDRTSLAPVLRRAVADRDAARAEVADLKERWLEIREARLDGMAAELASQIAVGASCPVCGSCEHPALAVSAHGSPDAAGERAARKAVDDAETVVVALDDRVRHLESQHAALVALTGSEQPGSLDDELAEAIDRHDEVAAAAARADVLRASVTGAETETHAVQAEIDAHEQRLAGLTSRLELHRAERDRLTTRVHAILDGSGQPTLSALLQHLTRRHDRLAEACAAHEELRFAERDRLAAERALADAAGRAGFTDVDDYRDALLDGPEVEGLVLRLDAAESRLARAREMLADPAHAAAARQPVPDLAGARRRREVAVSDARAAHARLEVATRRVTRLVTLGADLRAALEAWAPVREDLDLATHLSAFVEGKAADNALQMRLSAYVLAHRLSQVVAAANERLARMSDQRYSLEHTGRRGAGETRGGLSLLVRDDWSGESRDPATLSGGETFVVSLALALGLADVITQEAGGADLDTLFVDEGFGSLDAETLDDVMDTLDGLRDGGRVVGVVSHVAEMRDRIPTQLRVHKHRQRGSTVESVLA
ncbi:AAA family ATPase [Nocardioides terrigena]|uniref:AAA family ATPase n=1 Tax=Nocardioides terrigena TaxID=424797 RepID=UPI000D320729|nr:SMC family ATPase [Nocardioides terrigena]